MKTKILITSLIMLLAFTLNAQTHISKGSYKCLLVPNSGDGLSGLNCPACAKKEKMERDAKEAEQKRRSDAIIAERKAKDKARELEIIKEKELAKTNKPKEVYLTMPKSNVIKNKNPKINVAKNIININNYKGKLYPTNYSVGNEKWCAILNSKNDTIQKSSHFTLIEPNYGRYSIDELPDNIAIAEYNYKVPSFYPGYDFSPINLINSKGEKLIKDDNINWIQYCNNNLFIICSGGQMGNNVANVGTSITLYDNLNKITIPLENVTSELTFSPINNNGVDMSNYYSVSFNAKDKNGDKSKYGNRTMEACKELYYRNEWILIIYQSVGYKLGFPKYKIYYMEKDRTLKTLGIF